MYIFARYMLERLVDNIRCFLDVDSLRQSDQVENMDVQALPKHVSNSQTFMLFLTETVFDRYWVLEEIASAVKNKVPLLLVRETDKRHGALSLESLQEAVSSKLLKKRLFKKEIVDWHRGRCLVRPNTV